MTNTPAANLLRGAMIGAVLLLCGCSGSSGGSDAGSANAAQSGTDSLPASGAIAINARDGVVIENRRIDGADGPCIKVHRSTNVVIRNVELTNCAGVGVELYLSAQVTVTGSYFANVNGGVYALDSTGVRVTGNRFLNVSRAGKLDGSRGQFVQFNRVTGAGNEISLNRGVNVPGESDPEDLVNLFGSSGTAASPIQVVGNCFKGGGPSATGGGILTGEDGGGYVSVRDNTLVDPGQYGIGIAGGTAIEVTGNRIYGRQQPFSNVGMYLMNFGGDAACGNHRITGNQVDYTRSTGLPNPWYSDGACEAGLVMSGNVFGAKLAGLDCAI